MTGLVVLSVSKNVLDRMIGCMSGWVVINPSSSKDPNNLCKLLGRIESDEP